MAEEMNVFCTAMDNFLMLKLTAHGIFQPVPCQDGPRTNIVGAGWTSTHNPTNASDHLPYVEEGGLSQPNGPLCPVYTNTVVHALVTRQRGMTSRVLAFIREIRLTNTFFAVPSSSHEVL